MALALAGVYTLGRLPTNPGLLPLPQVDASAFAPGVRQQVEAALAAARADPKNPAAVGKLGMVLHAYEEFGAAAAAYERARALEPNGYWWLYYRGRALVRAARAEEGFDVLQEAVSLHPQYAPLWIELGDLRLAGGDPAEASLYYRSALKHDSSSAIGHYGLGQALQAQGETGAAAEQYRQALALAPQFGAAHYALALAARDLGEEEQARRHFGLYQSHRQTFAPARDPLMAAVTELKRSAMTHTTRATELAGAGKTDAAIAALLAALELDPQYLPAHANLIQLYSNQGRFDQAEDHFRAALAGGLPAPTARLHYARSLIKQQRLPEAVAVLEELLAINPYTAEGNV
ncbi:MAG: tetratricopeptide repeat protein, partial [Thermoanaerobaculia bacterium]